MRTRFTRKALILKIKSREESIHTHEPTREDPRCEEPLREDPLREGHIRGTHEEEVEEYGVEKPCSSHEVE